MVDILASRLANRGQWNSSKNLFGKCIISIDKLTNLHLLILIFNNWNIPRLFFLYFRLLHLVDRKWNLPMTVFEPQISDVGRDHSTNTHAPN